MQKGSEICLKTQAGFSALGFGTNIPKSGSFVLLTVPCLGGSGCDNHPDLGWPGLCPHILVWDVGMWCQAGSWGCFIQHQLCFYCFSDGVMQ